MFFNQFIRLNAFVAAALIACSASFAETVTSEDSADSSQVIHVTLNDDGSLTGHVFAVLDDEQAPMVASVTLAADGETIATGETDVVGKFSFRDVEPGEYTLEGVSGEYVGDQTVVVTTSEEAASNETEAYTAVALQVAYDGGFVDSGFAGGEVVGGGYYSPSTCGSFSSGSSCSSCGGGFGGGGGAGLGGGGLNLRRLAIIGAGVAIPVALSGGDPASPDDMGNGEMDMEVEAAIQ